MSTVVVAARPPVIADATAGGRARACDGDRDTVYPGQLTDAQRRDRLTDDRAGGLTGQLRALNDDPALRTPGGRRELARAWRALSVAVFDPWELGDLDANPWETLRRSTERLDRLARRALIARATAVLRRVAALADARHRVYVTQQVRRYVRNRPRTSIDARLRTRAAGGSLPAISPPTRPIGRGGYGHTARQCVQTEHVTIFDSAG